MRMILQIKITLQKWCCTNLHCKITLQALTTLFADVIISDYSFNCLFENVTKHIMKKNTLCAQWEQIVNCSMLCRTHFEGMFKLSQESKKWSEMTSQRKTKCPAGDTTIVITLLLHFSNTLPVWFVYYFTKSDIFIKMICSVRQWKTKSWEIK